MKRKYQNNKLSQATMGYVIFIIILIAAFSALTAKLRQKTQDSYKGSADAFGEGRQLGTLTTSGGVAQFVPPVLPLPGDTGVGPPNPPNFDCDTISLSALAEDLAIKATKAADLTQISTDARKVASDAQKVATEAWKEALIMRTAATQARTAATQARQAADDKQAECDNCNSDNRDCQSGCTDCTPICDAVTVLADAATEKEGIAAEKEGIAADKEAIHQEKQAVFEGLDAIAVSKEQERDNALAEAQAAADLLQAANAACSGG